MTFAQPSPGFSPTQATRIALRQQNPIAAVPRTRVLLYIPCALRALAAWSVSR